MTTEFDLPKGNYRVVFLVNVGVVAALFCEHYINETEQWACEYRFGRLKWRLVNHKIYTKISRVARIEEYTNLVRALNEAGYFVTSVLSCQTEL